jgi:hypothetical protein
MRTGPTKRPTWQIDEVLEKLIGVDIRVAAKRFSPLRWTGETLPRLLPVDQLILPDNSQARGLTVFFEGRLQRFERRIGVVFVELDEPAARDGISEGVNFFRGNMSVILRGPVVAELAFPFQVERLTADPENYWRDLRVSRAQFEFPFPTGTREKSDAASFRRNFTPPVSDECIPLAEQRLAPVDLPRPDAIKGNNGAKVAKEE